MNRFVALLRGINLGSHHRIAMPALQSALESAGFSDVSTYLQSGNVSLAAAASSKLGSRIQSVIKAKFGHEVTVIVRSGAQMKTIVKDNPFLADPKIDPTWLYVTFLAERPSPAALAQIDPELGGADKWQVEGCQVYLYCPGGYGRTKLSNDLFERKLKVPATTRNWKTVTALAGLA